MRAMLVTVLLLPALLFTALPARSDETPIADSAPQQAAADMDEEFRIPPGFRVKKRGKFTLYCRKEEVMGTRFASEKCYDETGIREMLRAQKEDQENVDRMRRICGSQAACGGGG